MKTWASKCHYEKKYVETKSYNKNQGRLFGGQYMDGISNATDAISMKRLACLLVCARVMHKVQ